MLAYAHAAGYECRALSFHYGQRHGVELAAAGRIAAAHGVAHAVVDIGQLTGSALTDDNRSIDRPGDADVVGQAVIPATYVPARNTIFLAHALSYAEATGAGDIFIGANAVDYSGYPDCRPEYLRAFQAVADLGTACGVAGRGIRVQAPLLALSKAQIITLGLALGVDYAQTTSCYNPRGRQPCRRCESCAIRAKGFAEAGISDPALEPACTR